MNFHLKQYLMNLTIKKMNDITQTNIKSKLDKALDTEKLKVSEAARIIGIMDQYLSMIRNEKTWHKVSKAAWESCLTWINSGQSLKEYGEKHGKCLPINHIPGPIISRVIDVKPAPDKITAPIAVKKIEPKPEQNFTDEARLKVCLDIEINLVVNGQKIRIA